MKILIGLALPVAGFVLFLGAPIVHGIEFGYILEVEARGYTENAHNPARFDSNFAVSIEPEFKHSFNGGDTLFTFTSFGRWDNKDHARRHIDIRELNVVHVAGNWETLAGLGKVFWGVAESSHLVDVINQTDFLEGIDGEDKLGQPMLRLSRSFDQSALTLFALPGFRERKFLSIENPIALPCEVNNKPEYESDDGDDHVDYALRFSGYRGIVDYGLSWFHGTSRDPIFNCGSRRIPFYALIDQYGLDVQATSGAWLWKLEAIRREFGNSIAANDFTAVVGGLEYSFYGMSDGLFDLGVLAEYHHDSRGDRATVVFQNDLFMGLRLGFNDAESSEVLAGAFIDRDDQTSSFRIEANRRAGKFFWADSRISLEAQAFSNVDPDNISFSLRDSDFVLLSLALFF
ncbi:hypothetical protein [Candidatus Spongiihabitans sp.]|uniref:hypothetical protein n=1 Tax=Candidatus Spongiihabitans sp. TaxID=3101308 RepID=UPI003C6EA475